jgi:hypothetical protein
MATGRQTIAHRYAGCMRHYWPGGGTGTAASRLRMRNPWNYRSICTGYFKLAALELAGPCHRIERGIPISLVAKSLSRTRVVLYTVKGMNGYRASRLSSVRLCSHWSACSYRPPIPCFPGQVPYLHHSNPSPFPDPTFHNRTTECVSSARPVRCSLLLLA